MKARLLRAICGRNGGIAGSPGFSLPFALVAPCNPPDRPVYHCCAIRGRDEPSLEIKVTVTKSWTDPASHSQARGRRWVHMHQHLPLIRRLNAQVLFTFQHTFVDDVHAMHCTETDVCSGERRAWHKPSKDIWSRNICRCRHPASYQDHMQFLPNRAIIMISTDRRG